MMDVLTPSQRHTNMAVVRSKDTRPEMIVRHWLWTRGFRYRLNDPRLPGHPDLVLRKYRTCIFVNGCFWHGHDGCKYFKLPQTNAEFWRKKISRNKERDREEQQQLARMGWHCITVWECQLRNLKGSGRWKVLPSPSTAYFSMTIRSDTSQQRRNLRWLRSLRRKRVKING